MSKYRGKESNYYREYVEAARQLHIWTNKKEDYCFKSHRE